VIFLYILYLLKVLGGDLEHIFVFVSEIFYFFFRSKIDCALESLKLNSAISGEGDGNHFDEQMMSTAELTPPPHPSVCLLGGYMVYCTPKTQEKWPPFAIQYPAIFCRVSAPPFVLC
jgi:hypothetical protein